jgi:hypothetical protein
MISGFCSVGDYRPGILGVGLFMYVLDNPNVANSTARLNIIEP